MWLPSWSLEISWGSRQSYPAGWDLGLDLLSLILSSLFYAEGKLQVTAQPAGPF